MCLVFDDVEYAELAFRDARDLVMYYRRQSQMIEETVRKNTKRKKNNQRSNQFNNDRHSHGIHLSSNPYQYSSLSYSKQYRHGLPSFNHRYKRSSMLYCLN